MASSAVYRKANVVFRIAGRIRVADNPQVPVREVLERDRYVVKERFRPGLDHCLVAIEVQAIKVEVLLGLKRLLHRVEAIASLLLFRSLCPNWQVRDDQQSDAADQPESSQVGSVLRMGSLCCPQNWPLSVLSCLDTGMVFSGEAPLDLGD